MKWILWKQDSLIHPLSLVSNTHSVTLGGKVACIVGASTVLDQKTVNTQCSRRDSVASWYWIDSCRSETFQNEIWNSGMKFITLSLPLGCTSEGWWATVMRPLHGWLGGGRGLCGLCTKGQIPLNEHSHPGERQQGFPKGKKHLTN